jgi:hypothetical protein
MRASHEFEIPPLNHLIHTAQSSPETKHKKIEKWEPQLCKYAATKFATYLVLHSFQKSSILAIIVRAMERSARDYSMCHVTHEVNFTRSQQ